MTLRERTNERSQEAVAVRPHVRGKFLYAGDEKLYVRGVTYSAFATDSDGNELFAADQVEHDFAAIAANGFNAVRVYTVPPRWLLDVAQQHQLRVMIGLPVEQHHAFLDEPGRARAIVERVRAAVRQCTGHPAVLCYVAGNEIPAAIVRWHGARRIERFLKRLYLAAKAEDPSALFTYVNYPTTEYLQLPFFDFVSFNVYLESRDKLKAYLGRLHSIAGDRPLVMAEIGLDSRRNGESAQARILDWQVRAIFGAGCAGAFVFGWTDEWHHGGHAIADWDFGLTNRERHPKPALEAVRTAFAEVPFSQNLAWPRISVVVCSYNGARTIRDTLEALTRLDYPDYEVIVVNDGSTDATPAIAAQYPVQLIGTENRGLSSARNTGMEAATGDIVAYTDDDAYPDPHWLAYLAHTFSTTDHVGVGGPNIAPPGDGPIADCVANAPGGPVHVLLSDTTAEHIPGCNSSFRRSALQAIGGYDPRYRTAGDDVDVCWRLQERGGTIGFSPAAMVWHHRRNSVRMYWKQQQGYGKAEALLEGKWPERYNAAGHTAWAGRLYGKGLTEALRLRGSRVYGGSGGSAPFQSVYQPAPGLLASLPLMPEWYFVIVALAALTALGVLWAPLLWTSVPLSLAVGLLLAQALRSASAAVFTTPGLTRWGRWQLRGLTALLHLLQPIARLRGRLRFDLTLWRRRGRGGFSAPLPRTVQVWSEQWCAPDAWLTALWKTLRDEGWIVTRGGDFDRWDLAVRGGVLGSARARMAVEEHGAGRQLIRGRVWPWLSPLAVILVGVSVALCTLAALDRAWIAAAVLGLLAALMVGRAIQECGRAFSAGRRVLSGLTPWKVAEV